MVPRWFRLATVIAIALHGLPAAADPAGAERAVTVAERLAASGDLLGAAAKYRDAFREHPRPDLMCNVGVAYYKAKDLPRAHRYLDQCLAIGTSLDPAFIANVKTVLAAVEQNLASSSFKPLNLLVQPQTATTTLDGNVHDEPLVGSRRVWVPFGTYRVTVHAEGFVDRQLEIHATDREPAEYSVRLDPAPQPSGSTEPRATAAPIDTMSPPVAQRSFVAPIVVSATTGLLGGVAFGFYLAALGSADKAGAGTFLEHEARTDEAHQRKYISWTVGGVAVVTAVVAGVLWYRALRAPPRVDVSATASGAAVSLTTRW